MPVSHVGLAVANLPASCSFFLASLSPLGYRYIGELNGQVGLGVTEADLFLRQGSSISPSQPAHVAFEAHSREEVDGFYFAALKAGGTVHHRPSIRDPWTGYYSASVLDLDDNSVEASHYPPTFQALRSTDSCSGAYREVLESRARLEPRPSIATRKNSLDRRNSNGSANVLVGSLLGAAAGALMTYAYVKSDRSATFPGYAAVETVRYEDNMRASPTSSRFSALNFGADHGETGSRASSWCYDKSSGRDATILAVSSTSSSPYNRLSGYPTAERLLLGAPPSRRASVQLMTLPFREDCRIACGESDSSSSHTARADRSSTVRSVTSSQGYHRRSSASSASRSQPGSASCSRPGSTSGALPRSASFAESTFEPVDYPLPPSVMSSSSRSQRRSSASSVPRSQPCSASMTESKIDPTEYQLPASVASSSSRRSQRSSALLPASDQDARPSRSFITYFQEEVGYHGDDSGSDGASLAPSDSISQCGSRKSRSGRNGHSSRRRKRTDSQSKWTVKSLPLRLVDRPEGTRSVVTEVRSRR